MNNRTIGALLAVGLVLSGGVLGETGQDLHSDCSGVNGAYGKGVCMGVFFGLEVLPLYCPPKGATNGQAIQIIKNFLAAHPERWQESGAGLAEEALVGVWPCR